MSAHLLACRGLVKRFGGITAVDGVDLDFRSGEVLGVIGPNGSGKTTLFNLLSGELRPSGGTITWDGQRIDGRSAHAVAAMGIVRTFQSASVFPEMSVRESMTFARWTARHRQGPSLAEAAALAGLGDRLDEPCAALPYGHQKMLGVALGLLTAPSLLLLDEPAAGLNQLEVRRFLKLIHDIRATRAIGIGIIDHDMSLVMPACDRIAVLNLGRLVATGTPAEIRANPEVVEIYLSGDVRDEQEQRA